MQNLTSCPKGHYMTPKKLFNVLIRYPHGKNATYNLKHTNVHFHQKMRNAMMPISYHVLKQVSMDLARIQFVFQQNLLDRGCCGSLFQSKRYFSTTPVKNTQKQNEQASKESSNDPEKDQNEKDALLGKVMQILFIIYLAYTLYNLQGQGTQQDPPSAVSWNEFVYQMLAKGEVNKVIVTLPANLVVIELHPGAVINGKAKGKKRYFMNMPTSDDFEEKLRKAEEDLGIKYDEGVPVEYERGMEKVAVVARVLLVIALLSLLAALRKKLPSINPMNMFSNMKRAKFTLVEPQTSSRGGVRFNDVAGLKEAKTEIMEFVDYLKNPTRYKSLGAKIPKGALLLGPPGCGKTLLAKAIATEASVPFLSMNGSEFIELLGGLGAARVRDLFEEGQKRAPSIIYIDEIDTIGKKRSETAEISLDSEADRTLNQLLVEMDGMASKDDVIILASTNRPEVLDKALLRPGRFDRHILIDLPTLEERKQIFETHMKTLVLDSAPSKYAGYLAYLTPNFSGADIANVCNEAALHAARFQKKVVEGADLMYAIDKTIGGTAKKTHAMLPAEKRVVAYRQAGHAVVGWLLEHTDGLLKITIVPRTNQRLGFSQSFVNDRKLHSQEELAEKICELLGGRAAEQLIFNRVSTSQAQNELQKVSKIAYHQVQQWGMSAKVGLVSFPLQKENESKKPYSKKLASLMDIEARRIITNAYERTEKLLADNKDKLVAVAEALLEKETLNYTDIEKLIGPPPFPKKHVDETNNLKTVFATPEQKVTDEQKAAETKLAAEQAAAEKKSAENNGAVPGQTST